MFEQTREPRLRFLYLDVDVHTTIIDRESLAVAGVKAKIANTGANAKVLAFNSLNRLRFGSPNTTVTAGGANFGRITTHANDPRQAQFGLKVIW